MKDLKIDIPDVKVLRFTRMVFDVSTSLFLLKVTIKHHMEQHSTEYPELVSLFMRLVYADEISFGADDEESAFEMHAKSKENVRKERFQSAQDCNQYNPCIKMKEQRKQLRLKVC